MIQIGIAGIPQAKKRKGMDAGIRYLSEIKLDAMEVQFVRGIFMDSDATKRVGETAKEVGIKLSVHAPYYINLAGNKETIEKSKNFIINSALRAIEMNANIVVFHPGYYSKKKDTFELIKSAFEEIKDKIEKKVLLGIETAGRKSQFGNLDEIIKITSEVEGTKPVLDFGHIHARGNGSLKSKSDFEGILDRFDHDEFHIHFSGVEYEDGNERKHIPVDDEPNFEHLAEVLIEGGYDATVICESPLLEADALKMREVINAKIKG
ncbi:MAG: TIM barrel protein [Methanocellales archaeon]|nr:TIM barrel protein [Methanocellales archaeon]MDD3420972.1 TIM barrel protein [Methanocellales archaeon]MDD4898285.1 TIM barrel protein [Methanocellales archaeon]MDD5446804.1 TIM barrel protein [Methanocellales archaeon]